MEASVRLLAVALYAFGFFVAMLISFYVGWRWRRTAGNHSAPMPAQPLPPMPSLFDRSAEWAQAAAEPRLDVRDRLVDPLVATLTTDDIDSLVGIVGQQRDGWELAQEVLYRLAWEEDPRLSTAALEKWERFVGAQADLRDDACRLPRERQSRSVLMHGILELDRAITVPIWRKGNLELGAGVLPCTFAVNEVWRRERPEYQSDRITLEFSVPADDGYSYAMSVDVDLYQMLLALEEWGEIDDRRAGEVCARGLYISGDQRGTTRLSATCAGAIVKLGIRQKQLHMRCDVIALQGRSDGSGTPDRLGMRIYPHGTAGSAYQPPLATSWMRRPTPFVQYGFRSIAPLVFAEPSPYRPSPQRWFEQRARYDELKGPSAKARVLP
jgi:hypothetical protein